MNRLDPIILGEHLEKYHKGREKAAFSKTLEAAFSVGGRELRRCVNFLRKNGFPICSDEFGYYYPVNICEVRNTVGRLDSLIREITKARDGMLVLPQAGLEKPADVFIRISINN